ncbi:MAG: hypothetical protein E7201_04205 [Selenomonas ruminantium]|uniref:Uncharacterized protein n=1 Tax=Selenomonas ruminantium TaxID=971 RepID=A0A927WI96_SELRU|nr:hypothetical protein [Selenomonas ruminantium]
MIPVLIAVGVAGLVGGAIIAANWDAVVEWLSNLVVKIRDAFNSFKKAIGHAGMVVAQKIREAITAIRHKLYYKEQGKWMLETTTCEVDESEVPPAIRKKVSEQEADISDDMQRVLGLEL